MATRFVNIDRNTPLLPPPLAQAVRHPFFVRVVPRRTQQNISDIVELLTDSPELRQRQVG